MNVAFLGLGIMGSRQAANLARKGFSLTVWNRTTATSEAFAAEYDGVTVAASPRDAAAAADVVVSMVVDGAQVETILLGEDGAAQEARPGTLFVDCTTIGVQEALRIGGALRERGFDMLDAPVTGSAPRAEDGTLTIMVGGEPEALERARPVLEAMGTLIVHAGPLGQGQLVKVINNAVAATNAATVAQALLLGHATGADLDALVAVMGAGSGASTMLDLKAEPMRRHDYTTLFKTDHMVKDVALCLEAGTAAGTAFPYAERTLATLRRASELGHGDEDFAALLVPLEEDAGTRL